MYLRESKLANGARLPLLMLRVIAAVRSALLMFIVQWPCTKPSKYSIR